MGNNAYKEKKPFSTWWEWLLGMPTGYDKKLGVNWGGLSGAGVFDNSIDWGKAGSGAKTGSQVGGSIYPGWGHLIGGVVGGAAGSGFVGSEDPNDGIAATFDGRSPQAEQRLGGYDYTQGGGPQYQQEQQQYMTNYY